MPAISAFSPISIVGGAVYAELTDAMSGFSGVIGEPGENSIASGSDVGSLVRVVPTAHPSAISACRKSTSYFDDYYNRIHLAPEEIDLGNTFGVQERTIRVWNSYVEQKTLSSVSAAAAVGLSLTDQPAPPLDYSPLQERAYELVATLNGPAIINASFLFNFGAEQPILIVTGRRILMFPFRPNWKQRFIETHEWKTEVIEAFDGSEQRRLLMSEPRLSFSYQILERGESVNMLDNLLWGWQNRLFALPVWSDRSELTTNVTSGDAVISVPTSDMAFTAGLAVIYSGAHSFEIVEVESVGPSSLTLKYPSVSSWEAGTPVYPCVIAHLPAQVRIRRYTDNVITADIDFDCEPSSTTPYLPTALPDVSYDATEVVTRQPNWKAPLDNTSTFDFLTVDNGYGPVRWFDKSAFPKISRPYSWLLKDRQSIRKMRELLMRRKGRLKPCYVPTWHSDFLIAEPIEAVVPTIVVKDSEFVRMVDLSVGKSRICIRTTTGQTYYREIVAMSSIGNNMSLSLDSALGTAYSVDQIKAIHTLNLCRLQTDKLTFEWHTDSVVVIDTPFITVKE